MKILKRLHYISPYERWMFASVAIATLLRLVLISFNWPITNSDEGNMGLLALHVAYQGDHPIFFYGSPYLGPLEGYAAAPFFRLFGASVFILRLPLVLFFIGFLVSMFYLIRLLYSEKFALATVILLGLGSPDLFFLQLRASGEYPEIEMLAALMCLLAAWLALSSQRLDQERWKRIVICGLLGLIVGLALWVDLLILPFVAAVGLLLCFFCRRELLRWTGLSLLLGFAIGAFPLIYYNLTAPADQNSWSVLLHLHQGGAADMLAQHLTWVNQLTGTMIIALPLATGGSLYCPSSAIPPSGSPTIATLPCVLFESGWGFGYLILWFIAVCLAVYAVLRYCRQMLAGTTQSTSLEERQEVIRQCGRLALLASVGLTLLLYVIAPTSATAPDTSFRYLTCLLLAIPALLWPIWQGLIQICSQSNNRLPARGDAGTYPSCQRWFLPVSATRLRRFLKDSAATDCVLPQAVSSAARSSRCAVSRDERHCAATLRVRQDARRRIPTTRPLLPRPYAVFLENGSQNWRTKVGLLLRGGLLLLVTGTFASGTIRTFMEIPPARAAYQQQEALVQDLLHVGATRVYADYWTCNNLTFLSREKIICSALDEHLNPGYDRYLPYRFIVRADPRPAYVFAPGTQQAEAMKQRVRLASSHYRAYIFEGYLVYQVI